MLSALRCGSLNAPPSLRTGVTSENVAAKYGVDRKTQDEFAARSHNRAADAQATGRFDSQIVPVHTMWKDPKTVRIRSLPWQHSRVYSKSRLIGGRLMQMKPAKPPSTLQRLSVCQELKGAYASFLWLFPTHAYPRPHPAG